MTYCVMQFVYLAILLTILQSVMSDVQSSKRQSPRINGISVEFNNRPDEIINVKCEASGVPEPKIFWTREKKRLLPNKKSIYWGNVMTISNVSSLDYGLFYCHANNGYGQRDVQSVNVKKMASVLFSNVRRR